MTFAPLAARLLPLLLLLGACTSPATDQPITGNQPAALPADSIAPPDTAAARPSGSVPFVNPTKVGRALGEQTPSPPASRTH
ncbi:hypothetical protein [Hymenobacter negativus]|uniref:Uncharacterized protein n=1 Tax=Hymenobacter negativus TaxID=2795026 RepID=A0ABS3QC56_9BACT|nr:hypothetical protein [Hymenobacter negativus]MBO2008831.1 hypothetical protein [Hymenobacter negativus]